MTNWTVPRYPGAAVRIVALRRGEEIGDVRIQHYGNNVRVAAFLPGRVVELPGDTPKTEPENYAWYPVPDRARRADEVFDCYLDQAKADGWVVVAGRTDG